MTQVRSGQCRHLHRIPDSRNPNRNPNRNRLDRLLYDEKLEVSRARLAVEDRLVWAGSIKAKSDYDAKRRELSTGDYDYDYDYDYDGETGVEKV